MNAIIFDPAHGIETVAKKMKCSPDQSYWEYIGSRKLIMKIVNLILANPIDNLEVFFDYVQLEQETSRVTRVKHYNGIARSYEHTLMLSLHNNAQRADQCVYEGWGRANGNEIWTSKGQDGSDYYATEWFNYFKKKYPLENFRSAMWEGNDPDKEADFTIIAGYKSVKPTYDAILPEWGFMTCEKDVNKLKDESYIDELAVNYYSWIKQLKFK